MKEGIKKPNFFIIGAPKCGTTALSEYLREHPDIFFFELKEIHYFITNFTYHIQKDKMQEMGKYTIGGRKILSGGFL